jgi:hypothetical protein
MDYLEFRQYKFPDVESNIVQLKKIDQLLSDQYKLESKFRVDEYIHGGVFDLNSFNKQVNKVNDIARELRRTREKIRLLKIKDVNIDHDDLTIGQFKSALFLDFFDMIVEIFSIDGFSFGKLSKIVNKNYRRISIFIIILIMVMLYISIIKYRDWITK